MSTPTVHAFLLVALEPAAPELPSLGTPALLAALLTALISYEDLALRRGT